jgi:hypothetical protein
MCEFVQTSMSRPQRKSGPTGRTAALLGEGERQLLSLGVWVKLIFLLSFGSLSLIRVTLLFAVWLMPSWHRCKHMSDRQWRALL